MFEILGLIYLTSHKSSYMIKIWEVIMKKKAIVLSSYKFLKKFNTEFKCLKFLEKNLWKKWDKMWVLSI